MNFINLILSNTIDIFGLKLPTAMIIFAGIALALIIVALVATGVAVTVTKKRKNANNVKVVAPNNQAINQADDGVYVVNYASNENTDANTMPDYTEKEKPTTDVESEMQTENEPPVESMVLDSDSDEVTDDSELEKLNVSEESQEEELSDNQAEELATNEDNTADNGDDLLDDENFIVTDEEAESEDENITKILQKLSEDRDVIDDEKYDTEDLSDDDIDAVFARKAREQMLKEKAQDASENAEPEVTEVEEYEEVAEELTEESEYIEIAEEISEENDLINPSEAHTTDQEIVIEGEQPQTEEVENVDIANTDIDFDDETAVPPPQAISCPNCGTVLSYEPRENFLYCTECFKRYKVPQKYQEDYIRYAWYIESESYREEQRRLERERIAEEERRKADAEYQEKLRLAKSEEERQRIELEEKLRQAEAQQRANRDNEEERERQRLEFEQMLKKVEEEKQAHLAQLSEEARKVEAIRLATEAMLQKLEADRLQKEEAQKVVVPVVTEEVDDSDEVEDDDLVISASKYKRSFKSKLIQGSDETKKYYSELRNELLSYNKMRCSSSWAGDTYMLGRKTCAKMAMAGKTLCLYLALNPDDFNPQTFHHKDKSDNRKYLQTPMQMRIKSDLAMRRAITLIVTMMSDNGVDKKAKFTREDYELSLGYRDDDALLKEGLIKLNLDAIQIIDKTLTDEDFEQEQSVQEQQPKNFREVKLVKKGQVGNLSQEDIKKIYKGKAEEPTFTNPNASKTGKFVIDEENGEFKFILYAASGDNIFESKVYKTRSGARNAIDSFRLALGENSNTQLGYLDGSYIFAIKYSASYISEPYPSKVSASKALNLIKRTSAVAIIEE